MKPDALAQVVVMAVKGAVGPVLARVAAAEAVLAERERVNVELRARITELETKAAQPPQTILPEPVDLGPLLERLATTEAGLKALSDIKERIVAIETKAAVPPPAPDLGDLRERLATVEACTHVQGTLEAAVHVTEKALATVSERVAVLETRAPVAGPAGAPGINGKDGTPGRDGVDGLGFDDLQVVQVDERRFTVKAIKGDRVKDIGTLTFPVLIYRGVYLENKTYEPGDVVTWAGSTWNANEPTSTKPGEGSKAWTLIVKRGRDGKDGKDGDPPAATVVKIR
jgi:hypothetical protein